MRHCATIHANENPFQTEEYVLYFFPAGVVPKTETKYQKPALLFESDIYLPSKFLISPAVMVAKIIGDFLCI